MDDIEKKQAVLIVDDNPNNLKVLSSALTEFGYDVRLAMNGKAALESAQTQAPDIILLDIHMPVMDGYEACQQLKKDIRTRDIPVIFVSAMNEEFNKVQGFKLGAVDYLTKPIQMEETRARVEMHLELRNKQKQLEGFNRLMVAGEMRLIEFKKEINSLLIELGRKEKYKIVE